jgi:ETC complex I subunit conserved region
VTLQVAYLIGRKHANARFQEFGKRIMTARIFKPAKSAMQSGLGRTKEWVLQEEPESAKSIDPLMGWTSSSDTEAQVELSFDTREEAIAYAERNGIAYTVQDPMPRKPVRKAYADNFKFGRIGSWTH